MFNVTRILMIASASVISWGVVAQPALGRNSSMGTKPAAESARENSEYCAQHFAIGSQQHKTCVVNLNSIASPPALDVQRTSGGRSNTSTFDALDAANAAYKRGDEAEAFRLTLAAARGGNASAQSLLAWHYSEGVGTKVDLTKSVYWLNESVKKGDPRGFYNLSIAYVNGAGVPKDLQKSFDYARNAERLGHPKAASLLASIRTYAGENNFTCMTYGFRQSTPDFGKCLLQLDQAQQQAELVRHQTEIAQRQLEFERQRLEQQRLAAAEAQRLAEADRIAAKRQKEADALKALGADMLCPKKTRGLFAEPVAGCGRNKNEPVPANVYVTIQH